MKSEDTSLTKFNFLLIALYIMTLGLSNLFNYYEYIITLSNVFNLLMIGLFCFIYIILALNEISIVENGYEKRYRFTLSILLVSLLSLGANCTVIVALFGTVIYLLIDSLRAGRLRAREFIYKFCSVTIPVNVMAIVFNLFGGEAAEVKFPTNVMLIIAAGILEYLTHTTLSVFYIKLHEGQASKPFKKLFYQEYGWIIKYDLWQTVYALLFYNTAVIYIYNNWQKLSSGESQINAGDFVYFALWLTFMAVILYIPIRNWLSSFNTFIFYNQQNIKNIIQDMEEGIIILDNEGRIKNINPSVENMFKGVYEFGIGQNVDSFFSELRKRIIDESSLDLLFDSVKNSQTVKTEISLQYPYSKFYNITVTSEVNRFGEITGNVITLDDVTKYRSLINEINEKNIKLEEYRTELENRLKELQETQEQLIISEKMAVIGQLVAGVAHEINTPLASIKSNMDMQRMLVDMLVPEDSEMVKTFKENSNSMSNISNMALDRIMEIVKGLKNFARLDEAEQKRVNLHEGVDSTLLLLQSQMSSKISVIKEYGDIPELICFPQQLNQVFLNILVNAIQAIEGEGIIRIATRHDANTIYISFSDSGIGIPQENLGKIFDPGFTTKGVGVGTGLGLSICYKIIEKHKGKIYAESEKGKGTTFTIELPLLA